MVDKNDLVSTYACVMWWWPLLSLCWPGWLGWLIPPLLPQQRLGRARPRPPSQGHNIVNYWSWDEESCLSSSGQNILTSGVCWHGMEMTWCEHLRSQKNGSPGRCRVAASCPVMDIAINTHLSVGYYHPTPPPPWHSDTGRRLQNICRQGASDRIL